MPGLCRAKKVHSKMSNIKPTARLIRKVIKKTFGLAPAIRGALAGAKRKKLEIYPQTVQVEATTACNADCVMCPHSKITREKGPMDFELYKKVVDDCAENSRFVKTFHPFLNGEFFLTPKWEDYLAYAREKLPKIKIEISTNGSLLDTKGINRLLKIGPDLINISFDGSSKETYENIRKNLNFDTVQNNIMQLTKQRNLLRKIRPYIVISIIETEQTSPGLKSFCKKWSSIADKVIVEPYSNWGGQVEDKCIKDTKTHRRMPCPRLWYNFTILNNGKVVICCFDYNGTIAVGDINRKSIKEIWTGREITELRNFHLEDRYSNIYLCRECNYYKSYLEPLIW